jgi:hypothetical protein
MSGSSLYFRVKPWKKGTLPAIQPPPATPARSFFKVGAYRTDSEAYYLPLLAMNKGRRKHQEKIQGKMKSTPLLFVMITSFASFPSPCENGITNNIISYGKVSVR